MTKTKRDFRSLPEAAQAKVRRLALQDIHNQLSVKETAKRYQVHYQTIYDWIKKNKALEQRDYKGEKRGRQKDVQKLIPPKLELKIQAIIKDTTPDQLSITASLWDRRAIQALIQQTIKKTLPLQRISVYTKRWGLTPQRPSKYAIEQDTEKVDQWLKVVYPEIVNRAKAEKAEIHWEDETAIALSTYHGKGYSVKGNTPKISIPAKRAKISMISSITNRGDVQFMLYEKGLKIPIFLKFLKRLVAHRGKKIFLIVDNFSVHRAKKVMKWVGDNQDKLEIFFPAALRSTV